MKQIRYVCTGNVFRSLSADYLTKDFSIKNNLDLIVSSAGIIAKRDSVPKIVLDILYQLGINAEDHEQTKLSKEHFEGLPLVIAMGKDHQEFIRINFNKNVPLFNQIAYGIDSSVLDGDEAIPHYEDHPDKVDVYIRSTIKHILNGVPDLVQNMKDFSIKTAISYDDFFSNNLIVGAHPDDAFLGAYSILKKADNNIVLTLTNGAMTNSPNYLGYAKTRKLEEQKVMKYLNVSEVRSLDLPDQQCHLNIDNIIEDIKKVILLSNPRRIFTHEVPQAHPDHEVANYCVHQAAKEVNFKGQIIEFPLYYRSNDGIKVHSTLTKAEFPVVANSLSKDEIAEREYIMGLYATQKEILFKNFKTDKEEFRIMFKPRDYSNFVFDSIYINSARPDKELVREMIVSNYTKRNS